MNASTARAPADVLESLAALAPVGLVSVDADGRVRASNETAATLLGRDVDTLSGTPFKDLFPRPEHARCEALLRQATSGAPATMTVTHPTDGGGVDASVAVAARPGGPHGGCVISLHVHVTSQEESRLASENARLQSEAEDARARLEEIVNGLDAIVWEADARTVAFTFVSKRAEELLGYPVEEWIGNASFWAEHIHPKDRAWCVDYCVNETEAGRDHEFEYRFIAADGRVVWLRDVVYVVPDDSGRARWLRGFMVDVTAEKRAEQQLRVQHAVASALVTAEDLDGAADAVVRALGKCVGWDAGALWHRGPGESVMRATHVAADDDRALVKLRDALTDRALARGDGGAAAEAWREGRVATALHPDPGAPSHAVARALERPATTAVPLTGVDGTHGVLEFYHAAPDAPHAELGHALRNAGALVGLYLERLRAEERAREERRHLSAILSSSLDGIVAVDAHGRVREFSPAAERIFGWRREDALGEDVSTFLEVDSARSAYESAVAAVTAAESRGEAGARLEVTGRRSDQSVFPVEVTVAEVAGEGPVAFSFTIRDRTQEKKTADKLRRLVADLDRERDRMEHLVGSLPGVVWEAAVTPTGDVANVTFVSGFVEAMLGYSRDEWLEDPGFCQSLVHPDDKDAVAARITDILNAREPGTMAFRWMRKDGGVVHAIAIASAIRDASGSPVGLRGITLDVTNEKRAEHALAVQLAVTARLASASSLDAAAGDLIEDVADTLGWKVGAYWARTEDDALACKRFWSARGADTARFEEATRGLTVHEDETLVGRVLVTGAPAWSSDVTRDAGFARAAAAADAGLRGAFAFPLRFDGRVIAVLEFFTGEALDPDAYLLNAANAIDQQVHAFLERVHANHRSRDALARRSAMVEGALDCIVSMDADGRIMEWNPAAERTFGWSREEALGRAMSDLIVPPEHRDAHVQGLARHVATGESRILGQRLNMPALKRDGSIVDVELTVVRSDLDGQPAFTGFIRALPDT